jgi:hypothetical protein
LSPRHVQIHYGQYRREQRYDPACRSRACAYLADDDHGPLELQEILLAGCATVGVRTGAAFVQHGVAGFVVDRLPPGRECVGGEDDENALVAYLDALGNTQSMDRRSVRATAAERFATDRIVDAILDSLAGADSLCRRVTFLPRRLAQDPWASIHCWRRSGRRAACGMRGHRRYPLRSWG